MKQRIEHVAFEVEHHELVGTVDFPFEAVADAVDGGLPIIAELQQPEPMRLAGDCLHEILWWVWRNGPKGRARPSAAFRKFLAISATIRPELFDNMSMEPLGKEVGCTKANLSKAALAFTNHFGLQFGRQHNGRQNMSAAMVRSHKSRKTIR
jgi:hypothetical protein